MNDVRWLTSDQLHAWLRLVGVVQLLPGTLDTQLQRDADLTHFEYFLMAMLSEAPEHSLRMSALAAHVNATLPRLSHVVARLESRGYVERLPCPDDRRASLAHLTETGWQKVVATAPGHVATVRQHVIDVLSDEQVRQLGEISEAVLRSLDPTNRLEVLSNEAEHA
jgi:DNA-binding MarR family transcriptional regulator